MKTLFANNETKKFDAFAIDVLTMDELALVKGGGGAESDDEGINWPD